MNILLFYAKHFYLFIFFLVWNVSWTYFLVYYAYIQICILHKHCSFMVSEVQKQFCCCFHGNIWGICFMAIKYMIYDSVKCKWTGTACFVPGRGTRVFVVFCGSSYIRRELFVLLCWSTSVKFGFPPTNLHCIMCRIVCMNLSKSPTSESSLNLQERVLEISKLYLLWLLNSLSWRNGLLLNTVKVVKGFHSNGQTALSFNQETFQPLLQHFVEVVRIIIQL